LGPDLIKQADQKVAIAELLIDGAPIEHPHGILAVLHKPAGVVCSTDEREGANVFELVPHRWHDRNPAITTIGRLDRDTTGVLLLTDQGELVQRWTSPRHKVPKVYEVTLDKPVDPALVALFASGTLHLDGESAPCAPAVLEPGVGTDVRLTLTEGRFHQVKRMFAAHRYLVTRLHRSRFGDYDLQGLAPGEWRLVPVPGA
jgi:16S rRNA pseudouridine516 synthase